MRANLNQGSRRTYRVGYAPIQPADDRLTIASIYLVRCGAAIQMFPVVSRKVKTNLSRATEKPRQSGSSARANLACGKRYIGRGEPMGCSVFGLIWRLTIE